ISPRHVYARHARAAVVLSRLRLSAGVSTDRHWRREADRAVGLFRVPNVRAVRLSGSDSEASASIAPSTRSIRARNAGSSGGSNSMINTAWQARQDVVTNRPSPVASILASP